MEIEKAGWKIFFGYCSRVQTKAIRRQQLMVDPEMVNMMVE